MTLISAASIPMFEPLRERGLTVASLLGTEEKWTQRASWRNAAGVEITECPIRTNPPASFDLMGAVCWVYDGKERETALLRLMDVLKASHFAQVWQWNDAAGRTYEEVMAMVRKAAI